MDFKNLGKTGYDRTASQYLAARARSSENVRLLEELVGKLPENARILGAGCGAGVPVAQILSSQFEVTGVDFSNAQIELARKNVPNAVFICRDMTRLDFPDETFDAICSYYAIIHIPRGEHGQLLIDFYRMLKPQGFALLCLGTENLFDDIEEDFFGVRMYWRHYGSRHVSGRYGRAPGVVNSIVRQQAIGNEDVIDVRPADLLEDEMDNLREAIGELAQSEEDVLSYAMFPEIGRDFLEKRAANALEPETLEPIKSAQDSGMGRLTEFNVTLHGETYHIRVTGSGHHHQDQRPFYLTIDGVPEEVLVDSLE